MAVIIDIGGSGIKGMAPMAVLLMVAADDGGGNDGIFTTASHDDDRHPRPHCLCPHLDKDWTAMWRARRDASHLSLPRLLLLAPSLSPLAE